MDDYIAEEVVANRDEPVPLVTGGGIEEASPTPSARQPGKRELLKQKTPSSPASKGTSEDAAPEPKTEAGFGLQDRLFARLLKQIIPPEDQQGGTDTSDPRLPQGFSRPSFSLPLMTSNFRRFNARVGILFVFQYRMIRLLSWRTPTHTLSFLAVYSFVCLDPYLLAVLPVVLVLLAIMVPSFIVRHPPPPATLPVDSYSAAGPPMAPPPSVKPAAEMSKDFFRNLRDLQNSMSDFSEVHDNIVRLVAPRTNFSDETLSSALFLFLSAVAGFLFLASHLMPWRAIFFVGGWATTCLGHPMVQRNLASVHKDHVRPRERKAQGWLSSWIETDIMLDSAPETREVEVFELQRRSGTGEWEGWMFSASPHDPLSIPRTAGSRPVGTPFFEDVQAPPGWRWSDKKWTLDLLSREWVEERMITGVEVETEGERWVYDILYDEDADESGGEKKRPPKKAIRPEWEENTGKGKRGEWRRRRWARVVERRPVLRNSNGKASPYKG